MPYTTIPTVADDQVLSAAYLNILSANQEFLYSLANSSNTPFASWKEQTSDVTNDDVEWVIRHRLQYYHYKIAVEDMNNMTFVRVWYNGVKVAGYEGDMTPVAGVLEGSYDLTSWAGLPNLAGAWALTTVYDDDLEGPDDDGEVVTHGGAYYRCLTSHTADAAKEPGVGVDWATYWDLLTLPAVGTMCRLWITLSRAAAAADVTIQYLFESDSDTL